MPRPAEHVPRMLASPLARVGRGALLAWAHVLLGTVFVASGSDVARHPGDRVDKAAATLAVIRRVAPLPADDALLVRANGAVQALAGAALILGVRPRAAAAVLAASLVPTTIASHPFWTIEDPRQRAAQRTQLQKNLAMLGGLILVVAGQP